MRVDSLQAALTFLKSWIDYRAQRVDIPGFSVAVYHQKKVVFSHAYGVANIERQEPLTTQHVFGVASQSKMFTSTAILQLSAAHKLRLDDPACNYLPWLTKHTDSRFRTITIRQLLSHSSGLIRDGLDADFWQGVKQFPDAAQLRRNVLAAPIALAPNASLKYSNLGFALLGQIIEAASGQAFSAYITRHIIQPLDLTSTLPDYSPELRGRLVTGYGLPFGQTRPAFRRHHPTKTLSAAAGIHTTPRDMCRFASAHFVGNELILNDALKKIAQTGQKVTDGGYDQGAELGLGFEILHIDSRRVIGHSGHMHGQTTATFFDPHDRLAVAVMANAKDAPVVEMVRGIFEVLNFFAEHRPAEVSTELQRFKARLHSTIGSVEIVPASNRIVAIDPNDWEPFSWPEELAPVNTTTLRVTTVGSIFNEGELIRYTFDKDVVRAVRYAGFTMLPEAAYRQSLRQRTAPSAHTLSLHDLQGVTTRIGRVVRIIEISGYWRYLMHIDFGLNLGIRTAYVHQLPPGMTWQSLRNQMVLGAVYPVWQFGKTVDEVMVLGLAGQHQLFSLSPGEPIALKQGQPGLLILPLNPSKRLHSQYYRQHFSSQLKFEPRQVYPADSVEGASSLKASLRGKPLESRVLLEKEALAVPKWIQAQYQQPATRIRIRVVEDSLTPYLRWELEYFRRFNIPMAQEVIYLLPKKALRGIDTPDGDFMMYDDSRSIVHSYNSDDTISHSSFYNADEGYDMRQFVELKTTLLRLAQQKGELLR